MGDLRDGAGWAPGAFEAMDDYIEPARPAG